MKIVIAANHSRYYKVFKKLNKELTHEVYWIGKEEDLTKEFLDRINPRYVFFLHWSTYIHEEIFLNYECVIFHMTDLPFGRGRCPMQNLVARGIYETKMTALKCQKEIDSGPVYLKRHFSLYGSAEEIYFRASKLILEMILTILDNNPVPIKQVGEPVYFQLRKPEEGNLSKLTSLEKIFDYIRMLDAEGYPNAFIDVGEFRYEFERAVFKNNHLHADVKIRKI